MSLPTVLLCGFEPFDGDDVNPACEVVGELAGERIAGHRVEPIVMPVTFAAAVAGLEAAISASRPSLVIGIGQAGSRARISIERVAINLLDARIADNAGAQPVDLPVIDGAPAAYFTTLPVKAMLAALASAHVPAELSLTAGSFVCNTMFFALMHLLATRHPDVRGGFIHVPYLPRQAAQRKDAASMDIGTLSKGIGIAVEAALLHRSDLALPGGSLD